MRRLWSGLLLLILLNGNHPAPAVPPSFNLGDPPVQGQLTLYGAEVGGGQAGLPVATGDFNGDGFLDLVRTPMLASFEQDSVPRPQAGLATVAFGSGEIEGWVDFASPPANTVILLGAREFDITGDEVWAGDVNGDGIDDILLCAQGTDGAAQSSSNSGSLYIVFGHEGLAGTIDLLDPPPFVTQIHGAKAGDRLGIWVRSGDLNGDPYDDILVGADNSDGPDGDRNQAGSAYILYGTDTWPATHVLNTPFPAGSVVFHGVNAGDHFGGTLNLADINGDGLNDILISAALNRSGAVFGGGPGSGGGDGPPGSTRTSAGESYVFFSPGEWPPVIDAASPPASVSMTVVYGSTSGDFVGEEVLGIDLNNDGSSDLVLGGLTASPLGRTDAGETWVLEGGEHLENRLIDLAQIPGDFTVTHILGAGVGDISGDTIIGGDVDGDGFEDLLLGSPFNTNMSGRVDVIFGRPDPFPSQIDLAAFPEDVRSVIILYAEPRDTLAYSMTAGDWDKDGLIDPMPNGMNADGFENGFLTSGDAYVVSGALLSALAPTFTPVPTATLTPTATITPTITSTRSADFNNNQRVDAVDLLFLIEEMTTD